MVANAVLLIVAGLVALGTVAPSSAAARKAVPMHLTLARELVAQIVPENNKYVLGGQFISFPSDAAAGKYAMKADCSGFMLALFERAGYSTRSRMMYLKDSARRTRHSAEDFVLSIENEAGFKRIRIIDDVRPGDLLAHAMLKVEDQMRTGTTGHVMLINSRPKLIASRRPVVAGTRQFEVSIIDSNAEHLGDDDSRLANPANRITGLGSGTIRIYVDAKGELVGWARTFSQSARFFSYRHQAAQGRCGQAGDGEDLIGGHRGRSMDVEGTGNDVNG
jgi:NlpC/P60 family